MSSASRQRLLVLGTGFGARHLLQRIDTRRYEVTVISPRNHFLFTPLLPSTTVGTVEFRTIIEPIRDVRHGLCDYLQGSAQRIDVAKRQVECTSVDGQSHWLQPYDHLVVTVGCVSSTLNVSGVQQHAFMLKELADARRMRERLIENLERASLPIVSDEAISRLLHFVAVGGGPTGVRFAAELYDLLQKDLARIFPRLHNRTRVTVVDSSPTLLSTYEEHLREHVQRVFHRRGIHFEPNAMVSRVTPTGVELKDGRSIEAGLVLWAVGFAPNPFVAALPWEKDKSGRLLVDHHLRVLGQEQIYAVGDCAATPEKPLPQLAQVAAQQGTYLAQRLNRPDEPAPPPFRWRNRGFSSYIGQSSAVVDNPETESRSAGYWAYQSWRISNWSELLSWRNRIWIPLDRLRATVFGRDLSHF